MSITLFVGDVTSEVAESATLHDADAQLITTTNLNFLGPGTYYTSLADCGRLENFSYVCEQAHEIFYVTVPTWSDANKANFSEQKKWTEFVLTYFKQTKPVHNLPTSITTSWLQSTRSAEHQFWAVGCSITAGVGVNPDQAWPDLVSKELKTPYTNLSHTGSSIIWQSDQICRSDIRSGEIVFWAVTGPDRMPIMMPDQTLMHLTTAKFLKNDYAISKLSPDLLRNDTLTYHNILAVRRAYNYCQKIGALMVPIGVCYDIDNVYTHYDIPHYYQMIQWGIKDYVDLGSDHSHPGPKQHKLFAEKFLSQYKKVKS